MEFKLKIDNIVKIKKSAADFTIQNLSVIENPATGEAKDSDIVKAICLSAFRKDVVGVVVSEGSCDCWQVYLFLDGIYFDRQYFEKKHLQTVWSRK